jgi:hypothetical protein
MAKAWKIWVCQFDWYEVASRFTLKGAEVQVGILLSSLGQGMTEIFDLFGLSAVKEKVVERFGGSSRNILRPTRIFHYKGGIC